MFVETILENGGVVKEWVSPPPAPTHKTKGINAIEWRRLFQPNEPFILDELRANIDNMAYEVPDSLVSLDSPATVIGLSITYRQFLRTCFNAFAEATNGGNGIDVEDELTYPSLICFETFGIIDAGRKEVIIQGVPL
jgi:hypothetical protein